LQLLKPWARFSSEASVICAGRRPATLVTCLSPRATSRQRVFSSGAELFSPCPELHAATVNVASMRARVRVIEIMIGSPVEFYNRLLDAGKGDTIYAGMV
jgi:hypothetical protein